ncbi:MAG: hypothetical protein AAGA75_25795 [Cyanobacteria bacterium P01_E01_bin.6]
MVTTSTSLQSALARLPQGAAEAVVDTTWQSSGNRVNGIVTDD